MVRLFSFAFLMVFLSLTANAKEVKIKHGGLTLNARCRRGRSADVLLRGVRPVRQRAKRSSSSCDAVVRLRLGRGAFA